MPLHSTPRSSLAACLRERAQKLRAAALDALAVVLPVTCASCGDVDRALCRACAERLARLTLVRECGLRISAADGSRIPVFAASDYDGPTKALVAALLVVTVAGHGHPDTATELDALMRGGVARGNHADQ